jgi:hypothetical protein
MTGTAGIVSRLAKAAKAAVGGLLRVRLTVLPKEGTVPQAMVDRLLSQTKTSRSVLGEREFARKLKKSIPPGGIIVPVGSRVTCDPPPTDTDEDYLLLVENTYKAAKSLKAFGFEYESDPQKVEEYMKMSEGMLGSFTSMRFGDVNYIITDSAFLFERFLTATHVAKELNLLRKEDRVMLFRAVRGGSFASLVCPEVAAVLGRLGDQADAVGKEDMTFDASLVQATSYSVNSSYLPF